MHELTRFGDRRRVAGVRPTMPPLPAATRSRLPAALCWAALGLATTLGCAERMVDRRDARGRDTERRLAVIEFFGDSAPLSVPDTVAVGAPVEVAVRSYASGCVGPGETDVALTGLRAEVKPYDYYVTRLPENAACTDELRMFEHTATVRFATPGRATVRVRGRREPGGTGRTFERAVVVR